MRRSVEGGKPSAEAGVCPDENAATRLKELSARTVMVLFNVADARSFESGETAIVVSGEKWLVSVRKHRID
jgi:hypothetical protein